MSKTKKTTETRSIPTWLEQGSQQAVGMANRISNRPFIQYGKDYSSEIARGRTTSTGSFPVAPVGVEGFQRVPMPKRGMPSTSGGYVNQQTGERIDEAEYQRRQQSPGGTTFNGETGQPYTDSELAAMELANGERVAGMDPNEQRAYDMAAAGSGYEADLDRARELTERGSRTFGEADIAGYMNPYLKNALDPAARELREQVGKDVAASKSAAVRAGAFGGSRATLLETETKRGGQEAIGDLYARGYQSAFEDAATRFNEDRVSAQRGAEQFRALGSQRQAQFMQDMNSLMTTGGLKRNLAQANLDFNYDQFLQARDWDVNNLKPLIATLASVPHGETVTQATKSGGLGEVVGLAIAAVGAFMGGGSGGAAADIGPGGSLTSPTTRGAPVSTGEGTFGTMPGQNGAGTGPKLAFSNTYQSAFAA